MDLAPRQLREIKYHSKFAETHLASYAEALGYEVLDSPQRRMWSAHWRLFDHLIAAELAGRRVLVLDRGIGGGAVHLARLGADVHACDLSPDMLRVTIALAEREGVSLAF